MTAKNFPLIGKLDLYHSIAFMLNC